MKTPQELLELFKDYFDNCRNGAEWFEVPREDLEPILATIQQDAFESGRVEGRKYELDRVASILRDSGKPEMVAMAFSCERLSAGISTPPTKTTEK